MPASFTWFFVHMPRAMTFEGHVLSPAEANKDLAYFGIPPPATDVHYIHDIFSGATKAAEFAIAEDAFLRWVCQQEWGPEHPGSAGDMALLREAARQGVATFQGPVLREIEMLHFDYLITAARPHAEPARVERAYWHDHPTGSDSGTQALYDLDMGRCYVRWNTF